MIYLGTQPVGNTVESGRTFDPSKMCFLSPDIQQEATISYYCVQVSTEPIDISGPRSETYCVTNICQFAQSSSPKMDVEVTLPRGVYVLFELQANVNADVYCEAMDEASGEMVELECSKRFTQFVTFPVKYAWEVSFFIPENSNAVIITFTEEGES